MAFHDVRLREDIERGAQGGPQFKTTVIELSSGKEKRNINWSEARAKYNIAYGIQQREDFQEVLAFFYARRGKAHSFRFKDWSDFEMARAQIGVGDGVDTTFQIAKTYEDGAYEYVRNIYKPVSGSVSVWVNNSLRTEGTHYTVNYLTGLITFTAPVTDTHAVEVQCQFDIAARFDIDELGVELVWYDAGSVPDITIVEVRAE